MDKVMIKVAGLDIGFSQTKATSAIGIYTNGTIHKLERRFGGEAACQPLNKHKPFAVIAFDGPLTPLHSPLAIKRNVERIFSRGKFQRRCKPAMSHIPGTGFTLRVHANQAANMLAPAAPCRSDLPEFPKVRNGGLIEAFPNAFLGVCLDEETFRAIPELKRGKKFDWLFDQWVEQSVVGAISELTAQEQKLFKYLFRTTHDHELRAGIICTLTALLVAKGAFTAVGDDAGGWFFLPPWSCWAYWAREALETNLREMQEQGDVSLKVIRTNS